MMIAENASIPYRISSDRVISGLTGQPIEGDKHGSFIAEFGDFQGYVRNGGDAFGF